MKFLQENWIWIVAPMAVVLILVIALLYFSDGGPGSDFVYPIN